MQNGNGEPFWHTVLPLTPQPLRPEFIRRSQGRAIEIAANGRPAGRPPAWTRPPARLGRRGRDVACNVSTDGFNPRPRERAGGRRRPTRGPRPLRPEFIRRSQGRAIEIAANGRPAGRPPAWTRPPARLGRRGRDVACNVSTDGFNPRPRERAGGRRRPTRGPRPLRPEFIRRSRRVAAPPPIEIGG